MSEVHDFSNVIHDTCLLEGGTEVWADSNHITFYAWSHNTPGELSAWDMPPPESSSLAKV